jgi:hypothetical protein
MDRVVGGGAPVAPQVRELIKAIGVPAPGQEIVHSDLEKVLGLNHHASRYRLVTAAWRKTLLTDHNRQVEAVRNVGFRCLLPNERITSSHHQIRRGVRRVARGVKTAVLTTPDDLDEIGRMRRSHLITHGSALVEKATDMQRSLPKLPAPATRPQQADANNPTEA